jgi:hypothetical protein
VELDGEEAPRQPAQEQHQEEGEDEDAAALEISDQVLFHAFPSRDPGAAPDPWSQNPDERRSGRSNHSTAPVAS